MNMIRDELCMLFNLKNLIASEARITKTHKSTIDLILTKKQISFQQNATTETGLSNFHNLISTYFKAHFSKLCPTSIYYRNYKFFDKNAFLEDLKKFDFEIKANNADQNHAFLTNTFLGILERHVP